MGDGGADGQSPHRDSRTVIALSERVAVVETKVNGLKDDTTVIRNNIHAINNDIQKMFAMEQRCADGLEQLLGITRDLPNIASTAKSFTEMRGNLQAVIETRQQQQGAWRAIMIVGTALMGAVSLGGAMVGGVLWIMGHIH